MEISTLLSFICINSSVAVLDINNVIAHGRLWIFYNFGTHLYRKLFINFRRNKDIAEEWVFKDLKVKLSDRYFTSENTTRGFPKCR